jgi:acetylornithine deacetylase
MHLFELVRTLVNIESVSGNETACVDFLRGFLSDRGFEVELQPVEGGRANVFAQRGNPEVVLSTHVDTVPPFFPASEDAEYVYGRGSCDAKGIVAAQIAAAERLMAEGVRNFALLFLVGEETMSEGARAANRSPRGSKFIINGEPTENKLAVGSKGILRVNLRARGRAAHSAYPQLGESAVEKLLDVLADLRQMPMPEDPVLGAATGNIGVIAGGCAANVIPEEATAQLMYRTVDNSGGLRAQVENVLRGRCEYEFVRETPAFLMEKLEGFETDIVAFTTDLPHLTRWGRPVLLGPGSIRVAHTGHERVAKAELERAVELYCKLVHDLKKRTLGAERASQGT